MNSMKYYNLGSGLDDTVCVPYISEYSDCTDANACTGCMRCSCNETGKWDCQQVFQCPPGDSPSELDDMVLDNALGVLYTGLQKKKRNKGAGSLVPSPPTPDEDLLLVPDMRTEIEEQLRMLMSRHKRSVNEEINNDTIRFYETVDEINEDTLKNINSNVTLKAPKINAEEFGKISRRKNVHEQNNALNNTDLHIEYNQPHKLEQHIAENKIDSKHPFEDKINGLSHEEIHKILGNYSQIIKDKDLSKLVVNELTHGSERIGDKHVVPVSNITFTPENDTLTAMTFIAGNLLNKLWDMEKDATEGSFETEALKHEKINDLLELFKEPLSLRQENFLKNALVKLSHIIDTNKDTKNMSLCANIEETIKSDINNCTEKSKISTERHSIIVNKNVKVGHSKDKTRATTNAINKINEVLSLIKKYEHLQEKLKSSKNLPESERKSTVSMEENISRDEKVSLNLFGNLLDKITKLLSPNSNGKRVTKKIQTHNILRNDDIARNNMEKLFNIDLGNMTMSTKDRMITDYLSNIEKHPNCFFSHLQNSVVTPFSNVEGNILYNLSEFFKIKSFTDLLKVVSDKPDSLKVHSTTHATTINYPTSTKQTSTTKNTMSRSYLKRKTGSLESAKERLKNDIKKILQDLIELQKEHGIKSKSNVNIADALPCIYNILKSDNGALEETSKNKESDSSTDKISSFIELLKRDMKFMSPSRRSNTNIAPRPKSAVVWERAIKNLDKKQQKTSRRYLGEKPIPYKELRDIMDKVELSSNTYKQDALQSGVEPSERIILLKTLQANNKQYTDVLKAIEKSLETITNLPLDKQNEIDEFVNNAAININFNKKVAELITELKGKAADMKPKAKLITESNQPLIMIPKWVNSNENQNFKLSRDQILNQLIMNRLKLYIKAKERTEVDLNANANYNIAKRILYHLESGNIALAKELYKVFLANKQQQSGDTLNKYTEYQGKHLFEKNKKVNSNGPKLLAFKEPLIRVEDPKKIKMLKQDYFLKQLWNLKDLNE